MIRVLQRGDIQAQARLMDAVFRLRCEPFVVRLDRIPTFRIEADNPRYDVVDRCDVDPYDVDPYDVEDAGYIVVLDERGDKILGCARMNHTPRSSLLADVFPHLNETDEPSRAATLYEGTRFALSLDLLRDRAAIRRVRAQICCASAKWAADQGGTQLQAVVDYNAFPDILEMTTLTRPLGLPGEYGGGPRVLGGGRCIAFRWNLVPELFEELEAYGLGADAESRSGLETIH